MFDHANMCGSFRSIRCSVIVFFFYLKLNKTPVPDIALRIFFYIKNTSPLSISIWKIYESFYNISQWYDLVFSSVIIRWYFYHRLVLYTHCIHIFMIAHDIVLSWYLYLSILSSVLCIFSVYISIMFQIFFWMKTK